MSSKPTRTASGRTGSRRKGGGRTQAAPPGRGAAWATGFWLVFLFISLLALVLVPIPLEREVREVRDSIRYVLAPAERLAAGVQSAQARQMEAVYSFLFLADAQARQRYRDARVEEEVALDSLSDLVDFLAGVAVTTAIPGDTVPVGTATWMQETLANLVPLSFSRHVSQEGILNRDLSEVGWRQGISTQEYRPLMAAEVSTFLEALSLTQALQDSLSKRMEIKEGVMARRRDRQTQYTRILVVLGLLATVVVVVLAWRLRVLVQESEARRREAHRARREADALLGATGDGVVGMDPDGRCTFLNRAGAEILGYSSRSVVGRDVHDLLHHSHPDGRPIPREDCPILRSVRAGETVSGRNETLWGAGRRPFPVQISLRAMMDGLEMKGAVLSFTDMTETRAAEESLRRAIQARDEVLAVVSHDLRNPVGTIFSAASLLLTLNPSPERQREHLLAVKRSAERMNRLIQDLLDVARLEAGALPLHPAPFHGERLLHEVMGAHRGRAEEKGVSIQVRVPARVPVAWGDRHRVTQILTNLVENALRETPAGGEIIVGVEEGPAEGGLRFFVSDNGPGIPPEDQERLFDRFWQVSRKNKGGAGLGLSIVKGIAEAHKGKVWVESGEGEGSTFWFFLPGGPEEAR